MINLDGTYKGFIALMSYVLEQGMHGEWAVEHMQTAKFQCTSIY